MRIIRSVVASLASVSLALPATAQEVSRNVGRLPSDERALFGDNGPVAGLALSGGGIRSSLYALGALAALQERGELDDFNIISSVSGGGYTNYWLFNNELVGSSRSERHTFGSESFGNGNLPRSICKLLINADFVSYREMVGALGVGLFTRRTVNGRSVELYEDNIMRTYGQSDSYDTPRTIAAFANAVRARRIPYLIVNASIYKTKQEVWPDGVIEFTPFAQTSYRGGFANWTDDRKAPEFRKLTAISGAALWFLRQPINNHLGFPPQRQFDLLDGGKTENLGAFALLRRNTGHVTIIDAEYDPQFGFGAIRNLQEGLTSIGYILAMEDGFDDGSRRPKKSAYTGAVVSSDSGKTTSAIDYVKMSLSDDMIELIAVETAAYKRGEDIEKATRLMRGKRNFDHCASMQASAFNMRDWSIHVLKSYRTGSTRHVRIRSRKRQVRSQKYVADIRSGDTTAYDFPHLWTADQAYGSHQASAYIALGYLQTSMLPRR